MAVSPYPTQLQPKADYPKKWEAAGGTHKEMMAMISSAKMVGRNEVTGSPFLPALSLPLLSFDLLGDCS